MTPTDSHAGTITFLFVPKKAESQLAKPLLFIIQSDRGRKEFPGLPRLRRESPYIRFFVITKLPELSQSFAKEQKNPLFRLHTKWCSILVGSQFSWSFCLAFMWAIGT